MPSVSTLKMAACMRSREEPDAVCWAEVAWYADQPTRACQWVGYVEGTLCAVITYDEEVSGFQVHVHREYMGHAPTAKEAAESAASILAERAGVVQDMVSWIRTAVLPPVVVIPQEVLQSVASAFNRRNSSVGRAQIRAAFGRR